ncbi:MAG: SDR family oxidoreductase [Polyangiaceae bacterium]|nr:SDR family oxidoreductase [Polyangiaceae bacterium]
MRWVVTGANRGIGLELVRQIAARGDRADALARDPSGAPELTAIAAASGGRVRTFACDVASDASVRAAAQAIGNDAIDVVINNAGVMGKMLSLEDVDTDDALRTFDTNALGSIRVARALLPQLERAKTRKIAGITSGMGSIADNTSGGAYAYRMSKAAMNMANKSMSTDLRARGFTCIVINPGWVQTAMGGRGAPMPVAESAKKILGVIDAVRPEQTGAFLNYDGTSYAF